MKTKILFVAAIDPYAISENLYPPLWPAFLAAFAEKELPNQGLDFVYDSGPVARLLKRHQPDLLALSSVTQNFGYAIKCAQEAKRLGIPVLVGGMHVSSLPTSMTREMDAACIGEGEQTFVELLRVFLAHGKFPTSALREIKGIAFYDGDEFVQTAPRPHLPQIDALPHPKRQLLGYRRRGHVYTARGCPFQCIFCSCHRFWGRVRYASAEYILEELEELAAHGTRVVRFADENFAANLPRLKAIAEKVQQRGLHRQLRFSCWCRANNVTTESVAVLRSMNIVSVKLGLESGSQRVLDYLKGQVTVAQNRQAVRMLKEAGMQVNADFLFGIPDETTEEMTETYEFIRTSPIDFFDINIFTPLPATPVWEVARNRGLVSDQSMDWSRLNFKFIDDSRRAIHMSERLTFHQLSDQHQHFQHLRTRHALRALPRSPWLSELPGLVLKTGRFKARKMFAALWP